MRRSGGEMVLRMSVIVWAVLRVCSGAVESRGEMFPKYLGGKRENETRSSTPTGRVVHVAPLSSLSS